MKKALLGLIIVFAFSFIHTAVRAEENFGGVIKNTIRNTVEEGENEGLSPKVIRQEVKEKVREQVQEHKESILDQVKNFIKKNLRFDARLNCTIDSIDETAKKLTVTCTDGETYTINVTEETKFARKFGGKSDFSELKDGDTINVFGKFTDENKDTVDAKLIRDLSIQKRWGVFFGEVTSEGTESFIIKTIQRESLTVYYDDETEFFNHKKEEIESSDINPGMRVRVKGIWDKTLNEVREVDEVRVFPVTPTKAPTETPTP